MFEHTHSIIHGYTPNTNARTLAHSNMAGKNHFAVVRWKYTMYVYCFIIAPTNMHNIYLCKWLYICKEATMARFSQPRKRLRPRSDSVFNADIQNAAQHNHRTNNYRYIYSFLYSISVAILGSAWANHTPTKIVRHSVWHAHAQLATRRICGRPEDAGPG